MNSTQDWFDTIWKWEKNASSNESDVANDFFTELSLQSNLSELELYKLYLTLDIN